jgi:hypothetical protein
LTFTKHNVSLSEQRQRGEGKASFFGAIFEVPSELLTRNFNKPRKDNGDDPDDLSPSNNTEE